MKFYRFILSLNIVTFNHVDLLITYDKNNSLVKLSLYRRKIFFTYDYFQLIVI